MPNQKSKKGKPNPPSKKKKVISKKTSPKKSLKSQKRETLTESAQRLNLTLAIGQFGAWDYNLKTKHIDWSENVHRLFGLAASAFDGTLEAFLNMVHPDDRERVTQLIDHTIKSKGSFSAEYKIMWPDGSIRWLESIGKVIMNTRGTAIRAAGTVQDITKKKLIEFDREDWKTRHELVSRSAGLVIYDYHIPTGEIIWSGNSQDVLGYKSEELGNIDRWVSLIHPEDRDHAFALLEEAEKELRPYDVMYRFSKKNGEYCFMHDRGFFLADRKGQAFRMLGIMQDISERVIAEQAIKESNRFRESIEQAIPDIIYVYDLQKNETLYINNNANHTLAHSNDQLEAMGSRILPLVIHPDDLKGIPQWTNEEKGTVKEVELRCLMSDGQYHWLLTRNTPFRWDNSGKVVQIIGIAQDVSHRKLVASRLTESEASYRQLFDNVSEAIFIQDPKGTFVDVNRGACLMSGYEKDELLGKNSYFLSAEGKNDFDLIEQMIKEALKGRMVSFEYWCKKKKGEILLAEVRLAKGSYFGKEMLIATARDITQRRNTEQALRDSEQRFRTLQQASFGGIGLHDQGMIIDCNQGLCDITGYSYKELIGSNGLTLISPEWRKFVIEKIQSGYEKPYDVEGLRKDGSRYMLEIQGKNIPYEGRMIRVTEFRDITDRKKTEQKIIEQNSKLQSLTEDLIRKNEQLEEFTQIVSHNLRSPVGNIVTLLNFFEGAATDVERKEYLNLLKESSATTLYMLNDLNEVLKIKQNKNIEKQDLQFIEVLDHVKSMLNAKIAQMSADIVHDFSAAPSIHYPGIYLESILLNLLDNALKYAHPKRAAQILFKTSINGAGNIVLEIKDNGLGLNLEKYGHHLFKLRKTFHRHPESRGIGLFMIKNQIEAMGGEISMTSKENEGSTFIINFNKYQNDGI